MTIVDDDDDEITTSMGKCGLALADTCTLDIMAVQVIFVDTIIGDDEKFIIEVKFRHVDGHGDSSVRSTDFTVYTSEAQADADARNIVKGQLWATDPELIVKWVHKRKDVEDKDIDATSLCKAVQKMQDALGEDAQQIILTMIGENLDALVELIISVESRGHFLASYDGEELRSEGLLFYRN